MALNPGVLLTSNDYIHGQQAPDLNFLVDAANQYRQNKRQDVKDKQVEEDRTRQKRVLDKQEEQMDIEAATNKAKNLNEREAARLKSLVFSQVQLKPLLERNDIEGARAHLTRRMSMLDELGIDKSDTQEQLALLDKDPKALLDESNKAVRLGQEMGLIKAPEVKEFEPVVDNKGNIIGQRNVRTGQVIEDPRAGKNQKSARTLTPEETKQAGYPAGSVVQVDATGKHEVTFKPNQGGAQMSPKERENARGKIRTAQLLRQQIADAKAKFEKIKNTTGAGPGSTLNPLHEGGQQYDAAVDQLRSTISNLTRTPGIGSMSDYETRLDQSKIPARGMFKYESTIEQQLDQMEDMAKFIEEGYSDLVGPDDITTQSPQGGGGGGQRIKFDEQGNPVKQ